MSNVSEKRCDPKTSLLMDEQGYVTLELKADKRPRIINLCFLEEFENFVKDSRTKLDAWKEQDKKDSLAKSIELAKQAAKPVEQVVAEQNPVEGVPVEI